MINIQTVLGLTALAIGGSIYFGKDKYDSYMNVLENMEFNLKNVRGINYSAGNIVFKVDVELVNPTKTAVDIPGNKLVVKNLHFYSPSGVKLGIATPNISNIEMPAMGSRLITDIPVSLPLATLGSSFSEIMQIVSNRDLLQITADLEAFGKSFSVSA